jgi:threonine/homoserine/homoserine lactone efflux protein
VPDVSVNTLLAFSLAALVLLVIPGPAVMYIVARSAAQGRRAGLVSVAGIHLGTVVHVVAAMVGLSAILAASATAFTTIKLIGAGYLIWLGLQSIRSHRSVVDDGGEPAVEVRPLARIFIDGVILNILNPKTALFFLSFVPQFIDPASTHPVLDLATLGAVFIALGFVSDGAYALAGGWVGSALRRSPRFRRTKDLVAGTTYIGLGAVTALSGGRTS